MKGLTPKQAGYVYNKRKTEGIIGIEQVYGCGSDHKQQSDSQLNSYECAMLNDFELHNIFMLKVLN